MPGHFVEKRKALTEFQYDRTKLNRYWPFTLVNRVLGVRIGMGGASKVVATDRFSYENSLIN